MLSSNEPSQRWSWVFTTASIWDTQENLTVNKILKLPQRTGFQHGYCSVFCIQVQLMESKACDAASAGCTGTSPHNASPKEVMALGTNLSAVSLLLFCTCVQEEFPAVGHNIPLAKPVQASLAEQEDHLNVSLSCWLTAPHRCKSRLRDLVWMHRDFLSCSGREQLKKWRTAPWCCWLCQLSHTERWNSCTNLQGCAPRLGKIHFIPIHTCCCHRRENKTPVVQIQILKVTNRTWPTHPHCTRYWMFIQTHWAGGQRNGGFPCLTEEQKMAQPRLHNSRWKSGSLRDTTQNWEQLPLPQVQGGTWLKESPG